MDIIKYGFMQNALVAALLAGLLCGLIGVIVVEKRLVMLTGGVAHTAYGGVGLGYLCGFSPLLGATLFSLGAAFGIGALRRRGGQRTEVLISLFWALGMAAGMIFVDLTPGTTPAIDSYLFGSILTVSASDLWLMGALTAIALFVFLALYQDFKAYLFDSTFASVAGMRVRVLEYTMLALIALATVVLLRVTGIMLTIALLAAPAAASAMLTRRLLPRMGCAALISVAVSVIGLFLSYLLDLQPGPVIVALAILVYAATAVLRALRTSRTR